MSRTIHHSAVILSSLLIFSACEVDNYDPPAATMFGKITDQDGEPVQSDPTGQGVKIIYIQQGDFTSPDKQGINLKTDGTFEKASFFQAFMTSSSGMRIF